MKVTQFATLTNVSVGTIRRWISIYAQFMTPGAIPPKGQTRILSPHDQRILNYVASMRDTGLDQDAITDRLAEMQQSDYRTLPDVPIEWEASEDTMPVGLAISRATEVVQVAVLQKELQHAQQELAVAQGRVEELETSLTQTQEHSAQLEQERTDLLVHVEKLKGDVARLEGYLMGYSFGREKPVSVAVIIGMALLSGALLVLISFIVSRLIM